MSIVSVDTEQLRESISKVARQINELHEKTTRFEYRFAMFRAAKAFIPAASGLTNMQMLSEQLGDIRKGLQRFEVAVNKYANEMAEMNVSLSLDCD